MMFYGNGMSGWGMLLMTVSNVLFWGLVIGGVIWFVARKARSHERSGIDRASDILAERFARGEIDEQEYRKRLDTLTNEHQARVEP